MYKDDALLVSLDIGSYKTAVIVAQQSLEGLEILGVGSAPSQGLRKGLILNVETTVQAIRKAVEEAQTGAGCDIYEVSSGIVGGYVDGITSQGLVVIEDQEVQAGDLHRVIEVARTRALPADCEILHVMPQEFLVDGQDRGKDPIGSSGVRLEAAVHLVAVASSAVQTITRCCERAGLSLHRLYFTALAAAEAVLTPEEKEMGVALLDIGGGTTSVTVFARGVPQHTAVLRLGGHNITNDLAVGLRTPLAEAEKLKHQHGCALMDLILPGETIEMARLGGREPVQLLRRRLGEIIEPRAEEILSLAKEQIEMTDLLDKLGSGLVLTGGGAILVGMHELAERVFRLPARRGRPQYLDGLVDELNSPMYATGVGVLLSSVQEGHRNGIGPTRHGRGWQRVRERVVEWIRDFF
jgi:cell division protein FtsA